MNDSTINGRPSLHCGALATALVQVWQVPKPTRASCLQPARLRLAYWPHASRHQVIADTAAYKEVANTSYLPDRY